MTPLPEPLCRIADVLAATPEFSGNVQMPDADADSPSDMLWVGDCGCGRCRCAWACFTLADDDRVALSFHRDVHPNLSALLMRVLVSAQIQVVLAGAWKFSRDGEMRFESDGYRRSPE